MEELSFVPYAEFFILDTNLKYRLLTKTRTIILTKFYNSIVF